MTATRNSHPVYDGVGRVTQLNTYTGSGTTLSLRTDTTYKGDGAVEQTKYSEGTTPTLKDTIDYVYDSLGRLAQVKRSGTTVLSDFGYNGDGTLASRADGDAGVTGTSTFTYDWADRLLTVDLPDATFSSAVPSFAWRADGLIASRKWSTSTAATFTYDKAKRPTQIAKGSLTFSQAYDRDGNVTSESRSLTGVTGDPGSGTQSFTYDALNRVTAGTGLAAGNRTYTYDLDGNRLTKTEGGVTFTAVFDRTDQQVSLIKTGGSSQTFTSDAYGNLTGNAETAAAVTTMTYDLGDKLTGIDAAGTANDATYTFDGLGRFKTRGLSGSTDTYSYVGTSETVLRISNSSGPTITDSIVSPSGDRLGVKQGATVNWLLPDLHGNTAAALDSSEATVVHAIRYDPYGQTIATGSAGGTPVGQANWKYQGRLDVSPAGLATPLYDTSARFYAPGLGSFTQLDSVVGGAQSPLSMNRFFYTLANPATFIDPSGHLTCSYGPDCNLIDDDLQSGKTNVGDQPKTSKSEKCQLGPEDCASLTPPVKKKAKDNQADWCRRYGECAPSTIAKQTPCSVNALGCTFENFEGMTADERIEWVRNFDLIWDSTYNTAEWHNNIIGILTFMRDRDLVRTGNWVSLIDSGILMGIQDGMALAEGRISYSKNPGAANRMDFFLHQKAAGNSDLDASKHLWGLAEQASTNYGLAVAAGRGVAPASDGEKFALIDFGNLYRTAVANPDQARAYVGGSMAAGMAGGGFVVGTLGGVGCGPLAWAWSPIAASVLAVGGAFSGWIAGSSLADDITDPRAVDPANRLAGALYDFGNGLP